MIWTLAVTSWQETIHERNQTAPEQSVSENREDLWYLVAIWDCRNQISFSVRRARRPLKHTVDADEIKGS